MIKGLTFGEAIECIKQGGTAWRKGWCPDCQYVSLGINITYQNFYGAQMAPGPKIISDERGTVHSKAIIYYDGNGIQVGWVPSQADMLSDDWRVCYINEGV